MKIQAYLSAVFFLFVFATNSVCAQDAIPKSKGGIASEKAFKNDEQSVLYVTDSVSRIRVAKMHSNDPMPGSYKKNVDKERNITVPGINIPGATMPFILKLPEKEIRLNHLNKIQPSWIEKLDIIKNPDILRYYNVEKGGAAGILTIKDKNQKDAVKAIEAPQ